MPSGSVLGKTAFIQDLISILSPDDDWIYQGKSAVWTGHRMDKTERLIKDYNLTTWMNDQYRGENSDVKYHPERLSENYRGLVRK